ISTLSLHDALPISSRLSFSSHQPPFRKFLKASKALDVSPSSLHNLCIRNAVHSIVPDGTAQIHRLSRFLRLQPGVDVDRHIRFGEVFSMQSAACDRISHVAAQLTVGCTGVHVCTAGPIPMRVDL